MIEVVENEDENVVDNEDDEEVSGSLEQDSSSNNSVNNEEELEDDGNRENEQDKSMMLLKNRFHSNSTTQKQQKVGETCENIKGNSIPVVVHEQSLRKGVVTGAEASIQGGRAGRLSSKFGVELKENEDSVDKLVCELELMIQYAQSKPALRQGSASFLRDHLRTLLIVSSNNAQRLIDQTDSKFGAVQLLSSHSHNAYDSNALPHEVLDLIFSKLDGNSLATCRQVSKSWKEFASCHKLWKSLCLKHWRALQYDSNLWPIIYRSDTNSSNENSINLLKESYNHERWIRIYPLIKGFPSWKIRLQKTGRFICNLIAHQISGRSLTSYGLPETLVVERRFNILHLENFILPEASVLYYEPESESDRNGFEEFIQYLTNRTRAGLALDDQRRFIFIPPCEYSKTHLGYSGNALLGVIQVAFPPLLA
uniref:F-box domain-containing protein n=1 Tax=Timspurckia oligopyrenoides TaxID=708627 RepID=A0A7S0ZH25_9RHOD